MPYFTSWDINVFLCLLSLDLPGDLIRDWIKKLKKIHEDLEQKNAMEYHCDRGKFVDMGKGMLYYTRADLCDRDWHFPKAINKLASIPVKFHNLYETGPVSKIRNIGVNILNLNRIIRKNFETAWSRGYINKRAVEWSRGFHPGRFYLMDVSREMANNFIIIKDLYSFGNWCRNVSIDNKINSEVIPKHKKPLIEMDINRNGWCIIQFIKEKDHIEDLH